MYLYQIRQSSSHLFTPEQMSISMKNSKICESEKGFWEICFILNL